MFQSIRIRAEKWPRLRMCRSQQIRVWSDTARSRPALSSNRIEAYSRKIRTRTPAETQPPHASARPGLASPSPLPSCNLDSRPRRIRRSKCRRPAPSCRCPPRDWDARPRDRRRSGGLTSRYRGHCDRQRRHRQQVRFERRTLRGHRIVLLYSSFPHQNGSPRSD